MALFDSALNDMRGAAILEPRSFMDYARQSGFSNLNTANIISVQSLRHLAPELKSAGVMVFRLGCQIGARGTVFGLARHNGSWDDYFLQDRSLFAGCQLHPVAIRQDGMRIFDILPKSTETSLVNVAVASGMLSAALQIDVESNPIINATAQGTYTFIVRPHQHLDALWLHNAGQVEIDGAFVAKRNGIETIFVVEAKVSSSFDSISKHKIAYPILAIETKLTNRTPVVGVYVRVLRRPSGLEFYVAECAFSSELREVSTLQPVKVSAYSYGHVS